MQGGEVSEVRLHLSARILCPPATAVAAAMAYTHSPHTLSPSATGQQTPALPPPAPAWQFYYLFGFLGLVFLILIITCAEITIVLCYFQLCSEVRGAGQLAGRSGWVRAEAPVFSV